MTQTLTHVDIDKATARGLCPRCGKVLISSTSGSVCSDFGCSLGLLPKLQEGAKTIEGREVNKKKKAKQIANLPKAEMVAGDVYRVGEKFMKLVRFGSPARMRKILEKKSSEEVKAAADRGLTLSEIMKIHEKYLVASGNVAIGKKFPKEVLAEILLVG